MPRLTYEELTGEALNLPSKAKAELARQLLASLEPLPEVEIDRLWLEEAERRDRELDAGGPNIPIEQVLERARASLK